MSRMLFAEPAGQTWLQFAELGLALVLFALIGLEREVRQKSAGLRTYTLVGLASALIILISKYGFTNILDEGRVVLDPSRMAAQIVSGIGFIGGGVISFARTWCAASPPRPRYGSPLRSAWLAAPVCRCWRSP